MTQDWVSWPKDWGELFGLVAIIVGFLIAFSTGEPAYAYGGAFLTGMMFGMRWYSVRKGATLHWYIIMLGFAVGYTLGSLFFASIKIIIGLFIAGFVVGYFFKKAITPQKKK